MASNDDIMRVLGRLEEGVSRLREDFQQEKESAHESRAVIHRRLDEHGQNVSKLETTVAISGQVDAQLRDKITSLDKQITENVTPSIEEWKRIKTMGLGMSSLLVIAGVSAASIAALAWDWFAAAFRHWLRIG
jgi:DNA-binding MurR/RpiR family transcriptional regulator